MCISFPCVETELQTASPSIRAELFDGAAGLRVGAAGWVMGVRCTTLSQVYMEPAGGLSYYESVEMEGARQQRTLGISAAAQIDLIIQSIPSRLCIVCVCEFGYRGGGAAIPGKKRFTHNERGCDNIDCVVVLGMGRL